jgi:hypothetical protein
LKCSRLDKFANNVEINFDLAGNAQLKAIEALEQGKRDIRFWHLQMAMLWLIWKKLGLEILHQLMQLKII